MGKTINTALNGAKTLAAIGAAATIGYSSAVAIGAAINDGKSIKNIIKETKNPTVYIVKVGKLWKTKKITVDPITSEIRNYTGSKVGKKTNIRLKKGQRYL